MTRGSGVSTTSATVAASGAVAEVPGTVDDADRGVGEEVE
jgi:hypothetical protein